MKPGLAIEDLLGRHILAYSTRYQERLIVAARDYWRAAGFPYPTITEAETRRELAHLVASDALVGRRDHGFLSTVGLRLANTYHPQLWHIKARGKSCVEVFEDDDRLACALAKAPAFWPGRCCWNGQNIRTLMRIAHKMRPSNFRPVVARQLIRAFSENGDSVLDFSAGFGGRLLGAVSLDRRYIAIDPARAQVAGLQRLYGRIRKHVPGRLELHQGCAEDLLPHAPSRSVDLVFSSPPYFNRERYSAELTQSYIRYPRLAEWTDSFLTPVLHHSARVLKPGGVMLLNIADRPDLDLKRSAIALCDGRLVLMGSVPYPMRTNPVGHPKGAHNREPILVFQKQPVDRAAVNRKIRIFGGITR
jgi:SAM-dependent methyltransferase